MLYTLDDAAGGTVFALYVVWFEEFIGLVEGLVVFKLDSLAFEDGFVDDLVAN
jgi:hypothetical protein